jgi:hypothetical protein
MHFTLCDYVLEIGENAIASGAGEIRILIEETRKQFRFVVTDNGPGMTRRQIEDAQDPFVTDGKKHPGRAVGLGLPFLVQAVTAVEGFFLIDSAPGSGTTVEASFPLTHLDLPPVGDVPSCLLHLLTFDGGYELEIHRRRTRLGAEETEYRIRRSEMIEVLGNLNEADTLILLREYLISLE